MAIARRAVRVGACVVILACAGCETVAHGSSQTLRVGTTDAMGEVPGASCRLSNNGGDWFVKTPGSVTVRRSDDLLNIKCTRDGYEPSDSSVESSNKAMSFGNLLLGGVISSGIDMGTGAGYDYPAVINVPMFKMVAPPGSLAAKPSN